MNERESIALVTYMNYFRDDRQRTETIISVQVDNAITPLLISSIRGIICGTRKNLDM